MRNGLLALAFLSLPLAAVGAQCTVTVTGSCTFGNTATESVSLTITAATRLISSVSTIALPAASATEFDAGFGAAASFGVQVRANSSWTLSVQAGSATWTGTGATARTDRPAADLQWATSASGPWTDLTVSTATIFTGGATGADLRTAYFRARLQWSLDTPGQYSLPVQLTISSP